MQNLVYCGSGPDAPETSLFLVAGDQVRPLPIPGVTKLAGAAISACGRFATLIDIAPGIARLLLARIDGAQIEVTCLLESKGDALYHPRLSPTGDKIGYLCTPGRFYPPKREDEAEFRTLDLADGAWQPNARRLPCLLSPFAWRPDGSAVVLVDPAGSLIRARLDRPMSDLLAAEGRLPAISPDGSTLAWMEGGRLRVKNGLDRTFDLDTAVDALAWSRDGRSLLAAAHTGFWQMSVLQIDPHSGVRRALYSAPEITMVAPLPQALAQAA